MIFLVCHMIGWLDWPDSSWPVSSTSLVDKIYAIHALCVDNFVNGLWRTRPFGRVRQECVERKRYLDHVSLWPYSSTTIDEVGHWQDSSRMQRERGVPWPCYLCGNFRQQPLTKKATWPGSSRVCRERERAGLALSMFSVWPFSSTVERIRNFLVLCFQYRYYLYE